MRPKPHNVLRWSQHNKCVDTFSNQYIKSENMTFICQGDISDGVLVSFDSSHMERPILKFRRDMQKGVTLGTLNVRFKIGASRKKAIRIVKKRGCFYSFVPRKSKNALSFAQFISSDQANCETLVKNGKLEVKLIKNVKKGEDVTIYSQSELSHNGKTYARQNQNPLRKYVGTCRV